MSDDIDSKGSIPRSDVPRNTVKEKPQPISKDRITVVETISHQRIGAGAKLGHPTESKYWRLLDHSDQPYQRQIKVSEEWTYLDLGWAKDWPGIGLIHVSNDEGRFYTVQPSAEEIAEADNKVLVLSLVRDDTDAWLILPGESMRGLPSSAKQLSIRCQSGTARATVTVYPA